jgi:hypothetical protein
MASFGSRMHNADWFQQLKNTQFWQSWFVSRMHNINWSHYVQDCIAFVTEHGSKNHKVDYTYFCQRLSRTRGHGATGRINLLNTELNPICYLLALSEAHLIFHVSMIRVKSKKNSNNSIGDRNLGLLDYSTVPQPNAPTLATFDSSSTSRTRCEICWQLNSDCIYTVTQSTPKHSGDEVDQTDLSAPRSCIARS